MTVRTCPPEFERIFARVRAILQKHAGPFAVADDLPQRYCLEGAVGPATLRAWGGKLKRPTIPVAWVETGKAYVSVHLMGMAGVTSLRDAMSTALQARMQGKTCFNFKTVDEDLFKELERVTARSFAALNDAGFVVPQASTSSSSTSPSSSRRKRSAGSPSGRRMPD